MIKPVTLIFFMLFYSNLLSQNKDTLVVNSIFELKKAVKLNLNKNKVVKLITHSIEYKIFTNDLDTNNCNTNCFIINFSDLIKKEKSIKKIKICIHMAMRDWCSQYSYRLDKMWEQIISELVKQGIDKNLLYGENYYDYKPLKLEPNEGETVEQFWKTEYLFNRRVEVIIDFK